MKQILILLALLATAACANVPTDPVEKVAYKTCSNQVLAQYSKSHYENGGALGTVLFGPLGNHIANPDQMSASDINPAVDKCMAEHGYSGFMAEN